jgi:hypothetical protein
MNVDDAPIVQMDQLVLSSPLDQVHARAAELSQDRPGRAPLERRVKQAHVIEYLTFDSCAERPNGTFNFR